MDPIFFFFLQKSLNQIFFIWYYFLFGPLE